jgi:protease-4
VESARAAVARLREGGKRAVAFTTGLDLPRYLLALACDEVITVEGAEFDVRGVAVEATFLKDTLARVGLEADFEALREYKSAMDALRRSDMSPAQREMLEAILDGWMDAAADAVRVARGVEPERFRALVDEAPFPAGRALAEGLIDAVAWEDELPRRLADEAVTRKRRKSDEGARIVAWPRARRRLRRRLRRRTGKAVGVLSLEGAIVVGESRRSPVAVPFGTLAGSETIARIVRAAERDDALAAVVLHVDSGGGSALASDLIWREISRLAGRKPVVAWMGGVAGSGGYYVTLGAQEIVAQPTTLTGSIGVITGKIVAGGLFERIDAHRETVQRGRMATLHTASRPFDAEERARVRALAEHTYDRFKRRVAGGRGLEPGRVEELARGRVWTGRQAHERGLVDHLGDLELAVQRAAALGGLRPDREPRVVQLEAPKRPEAPRPEKLAEAVLAHLRAVRALLAEGTLALMPWTLRPGGGA